MNSSRGNWASKLGFILAAAGSAVGLGNIWRFPYVTGKNGGGLFVMVYLACTIFIGLPIMIAETLLGRMTQSSPVVAFQKLTSPRSPWVANGWMGILAGFAILSYYSVVAGWTLHYVRLAVFNAFTGPTAEFSGETIKHISGLFDALRASAAANVGYHALFMGITVAVVYGGVQAGIERWSRILMPALLIMLLGLAVYALFLPGMGQAFTFVFAPHLENFKASTILMAMGQAFFSLSLGMGAMLTYGSYLPEETGVPKAALWVAFLDTMIALISGVVVFPIIFSHGMEPTSGPGLIFQSIPIAFAQMTGGWPLSVAFFLLLTFAAITSSISLMEVVTSNFIDLFGWPRRKVCLGAGTMIFLFGIPSALYGGFFGWVERITADFMLPIGGLLMAIYMGYVIDGETRKREFQRGTPWGGLLSTWLGLLRYVVPLAVTVVFLQSSKLWALLFG